MSEFNKPLKEAAGSKPAPQHYNRSADEYQVAEGEDGASFVKVSGSTLKAANVQVVTTAGTRVRLPNIPCREITLIARRLNTGYIYAGMNTVSATVFGVELATNDSYTFVVKNANEIYIDASVSGEGVSYVAI